MAIHVDRTGEPLVVIRYVGETSEADFEKYLAEYVAVLGAGRPYGVVLDALEAAPPTAKQRALQASWMRANQAELHRLCVGGAFAIRSPIVRGALTAILWLQPLPFPHTVVGSLTEAELWVRSRLMGAPRSSSAA